MPLESIEVLMKNAQRGGYAVGYFESWNLDSMQGVIDAAERTRSPVILGFSGNFLSQRDQANVDELALYGAIGVAAAAKAKVPCGFIFNECPDDAWVEAAIGAGFNLVMPADPSASEEEYTRRVKKLATLAHRKNVAVEADVKADEQGAAAYAQSAARFVKATGVDLLAVSVGNEEIKLEGRAALNLHRLEALKNQVSIPLVLHGGTGIEDYSLIAAIQLGVKKVNYGTYLKQRYINALRSAYSVGETNPHALIGDGGKTDTLVLGRATVCDAVLERIELLGCCGKA
jgi:fructose/tagatose bisphosphate aldolase